MGDVEPPLVLLMNTTAAVSTAASATLFQFSILRTFNFQGIGFKRVWRRAMERDGRSLAPNVPPWR